MEELYKYFNKNYWEYFQENIVTKELSKNIDFYNEIKAGELFDEDIYQALASLSKPMFNNRVDNYKKWLGKRIPALNNFTPLEICKQPNGMDWIREFIMRS